MQTINPRYQDDDFGGFPNPLTWFINLLHHLFPSLKRNVRRTLTIPLTPVLLAPDQGGIPQGARLVPYLRFRARVGHNSRFIGLSDDNYEELGGVEYRALTALLWIVSGVSTFPLPSPFKKRALTNTFPVLYRHAIDTICSACPIYVNVEMEG